MHGPRFALVSTTRLVIATLLIVTVCGRAQDAHSRKILWVPPRIDWPQTGADGVVIHRLSVADFSIALDQTTLQDAKQHLGGTIGSRGDAGDAEQWLCFHGSDEVGSWIFWLTSVEINGDAVGGFIWQRVDPGMSPDLRCRSLDGHDSIKLAPAIRLVMKKPKVMEILGAPTSTVRDSLFYMHEHKKTIETVEYTVFNGVEVTIRNGVVAQIAAFEISSD